MFDDQPLGVTRNDKTDGPGRVRGGRVRLSWLSWEVIAFLAVSALVAVVLTSRLELEDDGRKASTSGSHDVLLEALALGSNRDVLISSGWDDTVRFWNLDPSKATWGEEVLTLPHESHPYALAPSPDGRYLAVGGAGHLTIWENGSEGWKPAVARQGSDYRYLAFAPDSRTLAIGGQDGVVRVVEVPSMEQKRALSGLTDMVHSICFSPDGEFVAATSFRGELKTWDWKTGAEKPLGREVGRVQCFAFASDGRTIATAPWIGGDGGVVLWDLRTGEVRARFGDEGYNALAFSPDDGLLAAACVDQSIKVWDVRTGAVRGVLDKDVGWVKTILFTQEGSRLAYGGRDGSIRFWNLPDGSPNAPVGASISTSKPKAG